MEKHKLRCRLGYHNWERWEEKKVFISEHIYIYQTRSCQDCGKKRGRSKCEVQTV